MSAASDVASAVLGCPVAVSDLGPGRPDPDATRCVLACDPGVQTGWVLAVLSAGRVAPVASWVLGLRAVSERGRRRPACPPTPRDHLALVSACTGVVDAMRCDGWASLGMPVLVAEDWFAGPNPGTTRDVAQHYYFAEAAADLAGLTFRSVTHATWKKAYLGRGNMRTTDALAAYAARGHSAHPHVTRWSGDLSVADDAAALGVATWWLETEVT